jgi:hypothetical protein
MQSLFGEYKRLLVIFLIPAIILQLSCKKNWLDAKPDKSLVVPSTIQDYQAMIDNTGTQTAGVIPFNINQNAFGEISAGDFYVSAATYGQQQLYIKNIYRWAPDLFQGAINIEDWNQPYERIFYTNVVLEGIQKITPASNEQSAWNNVKGSALFFRAYSHFDVAQEFCKPYDKSTAASDVGIPLRLTSDFNQHSVRASVQETYNQIIADLKSAESLLPVTLPDNQLHKLRPTKTAVNAELARIYLSMQEYDSAWVYANASLQAYNTLINYDSLYKLNPNSTVPFPAYNAEVILSNALNNELIFFGSSRAIMDSTLYRSYGPNDVRKNILYRLVSGNVSWKGSYLGGSTKFSGLATDEMYLIRAEGYARKGDTTDALRDLNTLLANRYTAGTFVPVTGPSVSAVLAAIITERRKELVFRGLRWIDLRRLNKEQQFQVTLTRVVSGQTYTLLPNSPNYVLPIPDDVISETGMAQNPRQ